MEQLLFEKDTFSEPLVFKDRGFLEKISFFLFYKSLLPFLTFVNCEGPYLAEGFLHNLRLCFNIVFPQLGVITRKRNKFVEIVVASERYLIINSGIKEAAVPAIPSRKISRWKNVNEKRKKFFVPTLQYCKFEQHDWKNRIFFRKNKLNMNL